MTLLSEKENIDAHEFAASHYKNHCSGKNVAMAIRLSADQTGMGYVIKVRCPYCKDEKDITEYAVW